MIKDLRISLSAVVKIIILDKPSNLIFQPWNLNKLCCYHSDSVCNRTKALLI